GFSPGGVAPLRANPAPRHAASDQALAAMQPAEANAPVPALGASLFSSGPQGKTAKDILVLVVILFGLVLIGSVGHGTHTAIHLYFSLLIAYLLSVYTWSSRTIKFMAGILTYAAILVLVAIGWKEKYTDPLCGAGSWVIPFVLAYFFYEFVRSFEKDK